MGEFSADVFDGGFDPDGDASVQDLGGTVLARVIVVSNRVAIPERGGNLAGGLAVSIRSVLKTNPSVWKNCGTGRTPGLSGVP